jgi:hypothetical protein
MTDSPEAPISVEVFIAGHLNCWVKGTGQRDFHSIS